MTSYEAYENIKKIFFEALDNGFIDNVEYQYRSKYKKYFISTSGIYRVNVFHKQNDNILLEICDNVHHNKFGSYEYSLSIEEKDIIIFAPGKINYVDLLHCTCEEEYFQNSLLHNYEQFEYKDYVEMMEIKKIIDNL